MNLQVDEPKPTPDTSLVQPVVVMRGITKRFPGVTANDNIDLSIYKGEVLGLLGENGAGKTVLMSILAGIHKPDSGEIYIKGKKVVINNPATAIRHGIGMVHQHFMLIKELTVLENIILGYEPRSRGRLFVDFQSAREKVKQLQEKYKLYVNLDEILAKLPIGLQQRVEILKVLYRGADILILDEPTAVLTPEEVGNLFEIMKSFKQAGKAVIFITHKIREAIQICDRITVLRRGKVVGSLNVNVATPDALAEMMIGKRFISETIQRGITTKTPLLKISKVDVYNEKRVKVLSNVNLDVFSGEILGLAGVEGNGQTELVEVIIGLRKPDKGAVFMDGVNVTNMSISKRFELGFSYIPGDRHSALVQELSIMENILLGKHNNPPFSKRLFINKDILKAHSEMLVKDYNVRATNIYTLVKNLSGGNQQRIILARELSKNPQIILAVNPSRGLDIAATNFVHSKLIEMRNKGCAILLVSADLDEILNISDRIAFIYEGKIVTVRDSNVLKREEIGLLMSGIENEGNTTTREG
jgi:ABC-type uncharacterized transport system ATPase subunit